VYLFNVDEVLYRPDLAKARKEAEFMVFQLIKDIEERSTQKNVHIYYYTDKSRLELDDLMYYRLPKVPVGL
jgi:hypothetical protein